MSSTITPAAERTRTEPKGFIVGMSRSGTKWMSMCLNRHPDVAVFGETGFWGKHYVQPAESGLTPDQAQRLISGMPGIREMSTTEDGIPYPHGQATPVGREEGGLRGLFHPIGEEIARQEEHLSPRELFLRICGSVADTTGKDHVIEKTPHHINWIGRISEAFPAARFLIMCRGPYGFMRSYKHQGDRKSDSVGKRHRAMYHPAGCALVYRGYVRSIIDVLDGNPVHTELIRLSDVKDDAEQALRDACSFFEVDYFSRCHLPPLNTSFPGERRELSPVDIWWMNALAGREIEMMGFDQRKPAVSPLSILRSVAGIPAWGARVLLHLRRHQNMPATEYVKQWLHLSR